MLKDDFTWAIGGEAGFGINASGLIFSKTLARSGFNIFDYIEYPSLIRGGHNVYSVHASNQEVFSQGRGIDILVALNRETFDLHKEALKKESFVIDDQDQFKINQQEIVQKKINFLHIPLEKIIKEIGGIQLMQNNVTLGASVALLGLDLESLFSVIEDNFLNKGKEVVDKNQKAARLGYEYVKEHFTSTGHPEFISSDSEKQASLISGSIRRGVGNETGREERLVLTGNEAISLGAILGGCQFFSSYPMTPASSILHNLAAFAEKTVGMVVKHAEDEISVINMAIGASFAGARSAVATSGGGFALMEEAVSLAGMTETPVVIIECQRPAPATGMPTWTDQGDLQFILRSGHGEFPKIVLAPGDQEEAFYLTALSFNLADIYQCPVFVLSDKYLSESHKSVKSSKLKAQSSKLKINRGKLSTVDNKQQTANSYERYKITKDGISPRAIPGMKGFLFQANSYEHLEDGYTTEDPKERIKQVDKRARKMITFVKNHLPAPKIYGPEEADITLIGWGSTKMPALQLLNDLEAKSYPPRLARSSGEAGKLKVNYLHLNYLWPFPKSEVVKVLKRAKKTLLLEGNSTAQLSQLIRQETGIEIQNKYLKYDGRPFYPEDIVARVKRL